MTQTVTQTPTARKMQSNMDVQALANLAVRPEQYDIKDLQVKFHGGKNYFETLKDVQETAKDKRKVSKNRVLDKAYLELPDGSRLNMGTKFWSTFGSTFGISTNIFNYFSHDEVFERISRRRTNQGLNCKVVIDRTPDDSQMDGTALSILNKGKGILMPEQVAAIYDRAGARNISYAKGKLEAEFDCAVPSKFTLLDSGFETRFHSVLPFDGTESPHAYLMMYRLVCSNGMIAKAPAFRTAFNLGSSEDSTYDGVAAYERVLRSYNNEEGFAAIQHQIEIAANSYMSVAEWMSLSRSLSEAIAYDSLPKEESYKLRKPLYALAGNYANSVLSASSGLGLSKSAQKAIPLPHTVYDGINVATEIATHKIKSQIGRGKLNAWVGQRLGPDGINLPMSQEQYPDFTDLWIYGTDEEGKIQQETV